MVNPFIKSTTFFICLFFLQINLTSGQKNIRIFANENYWSSFVLNYDNNRFCYSFAKDEYVGSPVYCRGDFTKKGDTLFLKSDLDNKRLPLEIKCKKDNNNKLNKIFIKLTFCDTNWIIDNRSRKMIEKHLHLIINQHDTISYINDTIEYAEPIENLQISSFSISGLPEYFKMPDIRFEYTHYSTEIFDKIDNNNLFEINIYYFFCFEFYRPMNDFIVINDSGATWYLTDEKAHVNMKSVSLGEVQLVQVDCECWEKNGTLHFEVDNPDCESERRLQNDK